MKLSNRLLTVASFVTKGSNIADIGTDHGYVPIYLAQNGLIGHGLAMDVGQGPLMHAQAHIAECGLGTVLETRLSDGLAKLNSGEADTVIIAGMGGDLIIRILEQGKAVLESVQELILSPQSKLHKVRLYLQENGWKIIRESMLKEDGKFYTVMKAVNGTMPDQRSIDLKYGRLLIATGHPVLREFLLKEKQQYEQIVKHLKEQKDSSENERLSELVQELKEIGAALDEMQGMDS